MKWLSIIFYLLVIGACFFPWVTIESRNIVISGLDGSALGYGKPGLLHITLSVLVICFLLFGKMWSMRTAFFMGAFNIAWAARNFLALSACSGGICPHRHPALYVVLAASFLGLFFLLFIKGAPTEISKDNPLG